MQNTVVQARRSRYGAVAAGHPTHGEQPGACRPQQLAKRRPVRRRDVSASVNDSSNGETTSQEEPKRDIATWINTRFRRAVGGGDSGVLIEAGAIGLITGLSVVLFNSTIHEVSTEAPARCELLPSLAVRAIPISPNAADPFALRSPVAPPSVLGIFRSQRAGRGPWEPLARGTRTQCVSCAKHPKRSATQPLFRPSCERTFLHATMRVRLARLCLLWPSSSPPRPSVILL